MSVPPGATKCQTARLKTSIEPPLADGLSDLSALIDMNT